MILDLARDHSALPAEPEIIIVGAGAVGLTMAVDLTRRGRRVLVLEAGPAGPGQSSQRLIENARATGMPLPGLHAGRFRCLGGTTNFWGGQLMPLSPLVFEPRPWVSDAAWPISREALSPFYRKALELLGMERVLASDGEVWERLGVTPPPSDRTVEPIFTRWTPESNLAIHFRDEIAASRNLTVALQAQVGALVVTDGVVSGVEIRLPGGERLAVHGGTVVLANGTVEIARLLQLPDSEGRPAPWADNPWIGRGFMDHVDTYAGSVEPIDSRRFRDVFENAMIDRIKYNPKLRLSDAAQREHKLLDVAAHFVFNNSITENVGNLKILARGLLRGRVRRDVLRNPLALLRGLRFVGPMALRYLRYRRVMQFAHGGIQLRLTCEQAPQPQSAIRLRQERDSFDMPMVEVNWAVGDEVVPTLSRFGQAVAGYLEREGLAKVELHPRLRACDPGYLDETDDANHHMGGARMASAPEQGVVDAHCAVYGTRNLYVAGAAVFPVSGFANPTFTAMALGLRIAGHISREEHAALAA